jgi:RNA polymerase sigma factor (sigma-70 family)
MDEQEFLTDRFEEHRTHLRAVAYRMLGSVSEADDAVQEAWLRLRRADTSEVANLAGWLTTVVARVSLNMLRSRRTRREEPLDEHLFSVPAPRTDGTDPERQALVADSVGLALLVVLDTLTPAERLAFVLHDMFAVPFEEIAPIVDKSPAATRQLASRARRRVQGRPLVLEPDQSRQREVVAAFLAASREGDFEGLLAVLDPDVVIRADAAALRTAEARQGQGAPTLAGGGRGAAAVARTFAGKARGARPALVDGVPGATWLVNGTPYGVFRFTVRDGRITDIEVLLDPETVGGMDVELL